MSTQFLPEPIKGGPGSGPRPGQRNRAGTGDKISARNPNPKPLVDANPENFNKIHIDAIVSNIENHLGDVADGDMSEEDILEEVWTLAVDKAIDLDYSGSEAFRLATEAMHRLGFPGRKSMKSIFDEKLAAAIKGGPGSGRYPKGSGSESTEKNDWEKRPGQFSAYEKRRDRQRVAQFREDQRAGIDRTLGPAISVDPVNKINHQGLVDLGYQHQGNIKEKGKTISIYKHPNHGDKIYVHESGRTRVVRAQGFKKSLSFKSLAESIESRVDELKSQADLSSSIAQLEVALEIATTNEPINRAEGNLDQANLEVEHAASFNRALGLLRAGKSLPNDLFERVNEAMSLYVKGGAGSGNFGHAGRPGEQGGSGGGSSASQIRSSIQNSLDEKASDFRKDGSSTYVSSMTSPNMGDRHYIDIKHSIQPFEDKHSVAAQEHLDKIASDIRSENPGTMTYVSSMSSPNMGTRTFIDVKLPAKPKDYLTSIYKKNRRDY